MRVILAYASDNNIINFTGIMDLKRMSQPGAQTFSPFAEFNVSAEGGQE
jgi:hypothetical protein